MKEAMDAAKPKTQKVVHEPKVSAAACTISNDDNSDDDDNSCSGFLSDDTNDTKKGGRSKLTCVQKWINGNRDMRSRKDMYIARSTVDTLPQVLAKMKQYGFCENP